MKRNTILLQLEKPGGTRISEKIRDIILDNENIEMSFVTEALLYAASRAQHVHEKILPALKEGKIIICERFVHSSLVYQGIGRGIGIEKIKEINDFAIQGVKPDITLFFNIDPEVALKRKTSKNRGDRLEQEDINFHKEVYKGYLKIKEMYPDEIKLIDASKNIEEVFEQIKKAIEPLLQDLES
ncbi:dTMP kinase [Caldisalinibacter kiritimatiensis]|uniref:Thymidylate kinase n=1 Tax=Caldisalinibacter kiritimatiensis TaxID=1304284 RepID=R1AWQ0_9FIRM|nr:Thymidylate kinase [Caldisalinibacter kiritimatiensis]